LKKSIAEKTPKTDTADIALSRCIPKYGIVLGWIIYNHHRGTEFTENIFLFTHREVPMSEKQSVLFLQSLYREAVDCNVFAGTSRQIHSLKKLRVPCASVVKQHKKT
jgi:hypothetical protein